jgi:hypothetical protein
VSNLRSRVVALEKRRRQRGVEPMEIVVRGGLDDELEIVRATICDQDTETWRYFEREPDETEIAFVQRVRAARAEHGGFIAWGGLPEPKVWQDAALIENYSTNSPPALLSSPSDGLLNGG